MHVKNQGKETRKNTDFKKSVAEQFLVKNRSQQELKTSLQNDQISVFYKNIQKKIRIWIVILNFNF